MPYDFFTLSAVTNSLCSMVGSLYIDDNIISPQRGKVYTGVRGTPRLASYQRFLNGSLVMTRF